MIYVINEKNDNSITPDSKSVCIFALEKAKTAAEIKPYTSRVPMLFTDLHFSKLEIFSDFIYGFVHIPDFLLAENARLTFIYTPVRIIFIDRNNFALGCFQEVTSSGKENITSCGAVLCAMLNRILAKDMEKINAIQQNLAGLEKSILNDAIQNPLPEITAYRSRTMELYHYYIRLEEICEALKNDTHDFFSAEEKKLLDALCNKIGLLDREARQIWEYTSQIRDVYQQQLDVHQNGIMKFLTIVTTIFMPLTLITGWYGMNFSYMPELSWRYGYLTMLILSILLVIVLCIIFKKKKWW